MQKKTRSLMEELNEIASRKNKEVALEARATHIINSAINLFSLIKENFDPEAAYELERKFINSVRSSDPNKFIRSIRRINENKETLSRFKIIDGNLEKNDD